MTKKTSQRKTTRKHESKKPIIPVETGVLLLPFCEVIGNGGDGVDRARRMAKFIQKHVDTQNDEGIFPSFRFMKTLSEAVDKPGWTSAQTRLQKLTRGFDRKEKAVFERIVDEYAATLAVMGTLYGIWLGAKIAAAGAGAAVLPKGLAWDVARNAARISIERISESKRRLALASGGGAR